MACFPLIAEEITEHLLPESYLLVALKFFLKNFAFWVRVFSIFCTYISLRLKIHQAQAKNFCRVLVLRVSQIMETYPWQSCPFQHPLQHMQDAVR